MNKWFKNSIGLAISGIVICLILMLVGKHIVENNANEIETDSQTAIYSFLGKPIIINDFLCDQIASVANQDDMLSYKDW